MCGITGTYNFKRGELYIPYTQWCLQTMRHRGPDASSIWHNSQNYVAGFVRLAIRDLSANGNQPMLSDDSKYCLSFNGEIYNTDYLIEKIKYYKNTFQSTTDTEILLYALIYLGIEVTLQLADGIFAFALYDLHQNSLILARDRVGTKPLYIGNTAQGVVYSSQYDHIINHPFFKNEPLCEQAIASYLELGYMAEGAGVVNNTMMLPHGHYAIIEKNTVLIKEYYAFPVKNIQGNFIVEDAINKSVKSQLISDVPVGTFMSGGIDSTLVSFFAKQYTGLQSFTIGINDQSMDEANEAAQFAKSFKTIHHTKYLTEKDIPGLLKDNFNAFSEPFADYSSLPTLLLSKFAKQKVTVTLSGDGGDELFWGYPRNNKALHAISLYKKNKINRQGSLLVNKIKNSAITDISRHWNEKDFVSYAYSSMQVNGAQKWMDQVYKATPPVPYFYAKSKALFNKEMDEAAFMNLLRKMEVDIHLQRILLKVDRAGMYHSLEVRVPLLSNAMLQLATQYNYSSCIEKGAGKMPLRKLLMSKVNEHLAMQPKKGFTAPVDAWIRNELKKEVTEKLMDMPAALSTYFDKQKLQKLLSMHIDKGQHAGWFIWTVYSLIMWHNTHLNKQA
jgi:asparagine synthase (glutamine-hydrolysing)